MKIIKLKINLLLLGICFVAAHHIMAQSITSGPSRTGNYTITGFYASSPPVIDGILDDAVWTLSSTPTTVDGIVTGGAGFSAGSFPVATNSIKEIINTRDNGVLSGAPRATNVTKPYPVSAGSFGTAWDKNFFYFAVRIIDENIPISNVITVTNRELELFLNNGKARSFSAGPSIFPSLLGSSGRDVQIALGYIPTVVGVTEFPKIGDPGISIPQGFALPEGTYRFAVQRTADGFIYEGRIAWSRINKEFFNEANGNWLDEAADKAIWSPSKTRPALGFDVGYNLVRDDDVNAIADGTPQKGFPAGTIRQMQMWNQCCYNINWSMSNFYGVVKLGGDIIPVVCPTSITVALNPNNITAANGSSVATVTSSPPNATREIEYSVVGTVGGMSGVFNVAQIDLNSGVIKSINSGTATVIARSSNAECKLSSIAGSVFGQASLAISGQNSVSGFIITGSDVTTNWGTSQLSAVPIPSDAPNFVEWSLKATNLATINSVTGLLRATALGSGVVTVTAKSLTNGVETYKIINITTPVIMSCIVINSYTNIDQCDRSELTANVRELVNGSQVRILGQYYDPMVTIPGVVPTELMRYKVITSVGIPPSSFPLTQTAGDWVLQFNNLSGRITIVGAYFNNVNADTVKSLLILTIRAATSVPTICGTTFQVPITCTGSRVATGINDNFIESSSFVVAPNPASESVNVSLDLKQAGLMQVSILNTIGVELLSKSINGYVGNVSLDMNTSSLPPGLYIVKVKVAGGGVIAKKLLISK